MDTTIRCILCGSERDVTVAPTHPNIAAAFRAACGRELLPSGLCAVCRTLPPSEQLRLRALKLEGLGRRIAVYTGTPIEAVRLCISNILDATARAVEPAASERPN